MKIFMAKFPVGTSGNDGAVIAAEDEADAIILIPNGSGWGDARDATIRLLGGTECPRGVLYKIHEMERVS